MGLRRNPDGVERFLDSVPRVAALRQPWAGGRNPVGIITIHDVHAAPAAVRSVTTFVPARARRARRREIVHR